MLGWWKVRALVAILSLVPGCLALDGLKPADGLPLKTHIYADGSCSRSRANLYYIPDGFCIGPLYFPASSIRVTNAIPANCTLIAYDDGHCHGSEVPMSVARDVSPAIKGRVARRQQQAILGPTDGNSCIGVGEDPDTGVTDPGANSFILRC